VGLILKKKKEKKKRKNAGLLFSRITGKETKRDIQ